MTMSNLLNLFMSCEFRNIHMWYILSYKIHYHLQYNMIAARILPCVRWHRAECGLMDRFETEGTERTNVPGYHYHNDRRRLMTMMTTCTVIRINHLPRLGLRLSVTEANGWAAANQSETLHHYLTWYRGTCLYGCLLVCCSCCQSFHVNTFRTVKPKAKLQSPVPTKPQVPI